MVGRPPFHPDEVFGATAGSHLASSSDTLRTCHPLQEHGRYQGELGGCAGSPALGAVVLVPRGSCATLLPCPPCREGDASVSTAERRTIQPIY